jgi:hypothetical protein
LKLGERTKGSGAGTRTITKREPQLNLGRTTGRAPAAGRGAAFAGSQPRLKFGGRRREGALAGAGLAGSGLAGSGLAGARLAGGGLSGSRFSSSTMGRSLLGGSVFSRSSFGKPPSFGRSAPLGRSSPFRRGSLTGLPAAGAKVRFSRGGSVGRLTGGLFSGGRRRPGSPKSPGRGWLRGTSSRTTRNRNRTGLGGIGLGSGGLGSGRGLGSDLNGRRSVTGKAFGKARGRGTWSGTRGSSLRSGRSGPARLRMPRPKAKRRWRTGGYR